MIAPGMLMRERAPPAAFAALAAPLEVGGHLLRNRFVQGPMCAMYAAADGSATRQTVEYYRARAAGGAALVIVEITFTDDGGSRAFHAQLGAHSDTMIPGLSDLAEAIAAHGALPGLQLGHCGPQRVISAGPLIALQDLPEKILRTQEEVTHVTIPIGSSVEEAEKKLILETLAAVGNNKAKAARVLGVSRKTLHNKLNAFALQRGG